MTTRAGKKKIKARFFCAYCSTEVDPKAERCPSCGKFFSAVTCPSCGFTGDAESFIRGCPVCGYLVPVETGPSPGGGRKTGGMDGHRDRRGPSASFYRIAAILLVSVLAVLIVMLLLISR